MRGCRVAWLLSCVAAGLRGCVAVGQLQTFSAVFSYVEYNNLYSTYKKTAVQIGAWLLDCATAGLRGCGVTWLQGCCKIFKLYSSLATVTKWPRQPVDLHHRDALNVTAFI